MAEDDYHAFIAAVTSEFREALGGEVAQAPPQECFDPLIEAYGLEFNPVRLQETTERQMADLQEAFAEHFECEISADAIREAVLRSKARWPA